MTIKLFNTLSREKEEFVPIKPGAVSLYTCGPTVYQYASIGNLRCYLFNDTLKRVLLANNFAVKHVMNITDVGHLTGDRDMGEDKIAKSAREQKLTAFDVARKYEEAFFKDTDALNILRPSLSCRATEHIKEQIDFVVDLEKKGFTYKTSDGIYFDTSKAVDYGKLARLDILGLREGARVEKNDEKKNATDFVLWKFSPEGPKRDMEWESPWGIGFPGWHIECSAMSEKYLGFPFDIHTGGIDHIPVHHTNEIAQNEAKSGGARTVNIWMHNAFLLIDDGKMSKSLGNTYTISDLETKGYDPLAFRYFFLTAHYRQSQNFTWEALAGAEAAYKKLIRSVTALIVTSNNAAGTPNEKWLANFMEAADDDLNMPRALATLWELLKDDTIPPGDKLATIYKFDKILGLTLKEKATAQIESGSNIPTEVQALAKAREEARAGKNWSESDRLREEIEKLGYKIKDSAEGMTVEKI